MGREAESTGHRHQRLQELIFEELVAIVRDDTSDPALDDVQITAVVLSVDYKHARVHFALRGALEVVAERVARVKRAIDRATPFLRARLAEAIDVKRVPELRFVFDGVAPPDAAR
jgi:ribosome-binding factor A